MIPLPSRSAKAGFTLVELLVAIAVLSLLVILVSKIVGGASTITTYNNSHMDSNDQARLVFDRMANDFSRMLKRPDADVIFCKQPSPGMNDTLFFFSESAGGFFQGSTSDTSTSTATTNHTWTPEKDNISLVGYRINNNDATGSPYGELERLGKALPWDATVTGTTNPFPMVYLTYPPAGTAPTGTTYSSADYDSTIRGAFSNAAQTAGYTTSPVGTLNGYFNDSTDTDYHVLGSQVFRLEYSFLLKDGTQSIVPVMAPATTSDPNGVPSNSPNNLQASGVPPTTDSATPPLTYPVGSRWYDTTNHIGYICTSNTSGQPVWKEIGVQDITAIIVTIATIDNAGRYMINTSFKSDPTLLGTLAQQFPKWVASGGTTNNTSADTLVANWTAAILPGSGNTPSTASKATSLPQSVISRIRIYQRYFYLDTP